MKDIDELITKYSIEVALLYIEFKKGNCKMEEVERLSKALDELINKRMTFYIETAEKRF